MPKILIANWKMNPVTEKEAVALARAEDVRSAVICPPFPFLGAVKKVLKRASLGAQDGFWKEVGAYTGEVSPLQLKKIGVKYVIIGHSERRLNLGETNEMIAQKLFVALRAGLTPIFCVGETKEEHERGEMKEVLDRQLRVGLAAVRAGTIAKEFFITYEPVWAISTMPGATADTPEGAAEAIRYIKSQVKDLVRPPVLIYGGSVNAVNAAGFLRHPDISGALVGGASLKPVEFKKIINLVA